MDKHIIDLYDDFTHGGMNRRAFLDRLAALAGSTAAATALLPVLQNNYAQAQTIPENDPRIDGRRWSIFPVRRASRVIWSSPNPAASCRP